MAARHILQCIMAIALTVATVTDGQTAEASAPETEPGASWSISLQGGYLHQFDTGIDNGGSFSVDRFFAQGGPSYTVAEGRSVGLTLGYGRDAYDFSGHEGFAALEPWEDVDDWRLGLPVRWRFDRDWSLFAAPTLRFTGETGADLGNAISGGVFAGVAYRFNERLTIGPGFGLLTQLEDRTRLIPVLLVEWKITDTIDLSTGQGVAATLGPGLTLNWQLSPKWRLSFGGRAESLRFRLDDDGPVPDGIGQDRSYPIFCGVLYRFTPRVQASLIGGVELGGQLTLEDEDGHKVIEEDHDPAPFLGLSFSARF